MSDISNELRKMLDERSIEYECHDRSDERYQYKCTEWDFEHGGIQFIEYPDSTVMSISNYLTNNPTPAQAIAATLRAGTCRMKYCLNYDKFYYQCSVCGNVTLEDKPNYCPNCGAKVIE